MAADLESSYREVEEKSKAYATYKQVTDDIKSLKKSAGNNLTQADRLVNKGLPDGLSNVTKKYEQEVKNQFDRLLDFAKFNPNGRGAQGNSTTLNYIKKALIASANRSSPKIMKLLQDEMINALGCSEQEEYQQGIQVTVPLWSIDLFKQLKQEPNSVTGKQQSMLCYCLVDTPIEMVEDEIRRAHWKLHKIDEDYDLREEILRKHEFSQIPKNRRVKVFYVQKDEQVIDQIKEKIEYCREYYNALMKLMKHLLV